MQRGPPPASPAREREVARFQSNTVPRPCPRLPCAARQIRVDFSDDMVAYARGWIDRSDVTAGRDKGEVIIRCLNGHVTQLVPLGTAFRRHTRCHSYMPAAHLRIYELVVSARGSWTMMLPYHVGVPLLLLVSQFLLGPCLVALCKVFEKTFFYI